MSEKTTNATVEDAKIVGEKPFVEEVRDAMIKHGHAPDGFAVKHPYVYSAIQAGATAAFWGCIAYVGYRRGVSVGTKRATQSQASA